MAIGVQWSSASRRNSTVTGPKALLGSKGPKGPQVRYMGPLGPMGYTKYLYPTRPKGLVTLGLKALIPPKGLWPLVCILGALPPDPPVPYAVSSSTRVLLL